MTTILTITLLSLSSDSLVIASPSNGDKDDLFDNGDKDDLFDNGDLAKIFDFGTGVFATILFALSLIAYKNLRSKRLLFVSAAFALFAIRTIVSRFDLFLPEIESSILELVLAVMSFTSLSLFFFAIVRRKKINTKSLQT
jgi:hypothetical protein